uniref:Abnormal cell migration protein 18-like fibronectin type I domain-containing protein n=1 Tax=Romanomermis culicivorax TaxID=13658 RepID=A0A915K9T7_ROMCU
MQHFRILPTTYHRVCYKDQIMNNGTNVDQTQIETLSHIFLQAQRPGYIFCITVCILDIASGAFFLFIAKYPADITTHFYIKCSVVWEMTSSFVYGVSNIVHLYISLTNGSEAITMWKCFVSFGSISYYCVLASDYFSVLVSIDRSVSLLKPLTHKEFDKFRYTVSTAVPILLYCSMVVYLFAGSHNLFSWNNNSNNNNRVTELRLKMRDHVFKALIFNTFWRLMTNVVVNVSALLSVNLPYRGSLTGIFFAPLYFTDGCGMLVSYTFFVKKFRTNLMSLMKNKGSVSPVIAIDLPRNHSQRLTSNIQTISLGHARIVHYGAEDIAPINGSIDTDGDFVYQCDIQLIKPIACMYRGVRINMGQQYPANDFVITCQGLVNGGIEQRPVACMGDAWYRAAPNTIFIKNGRRYRCMINGRNGHIEPETSGIMPIL